MSLRRFRPKLVPTLMTVPMLAVLIGLGSWQIERLQWKETLIERLQSRATLAPIPLPAGPLDIDEYEFRPVTVTGRFDHGHEFHLVNRSRNGEAGLHILTPLLPVDGGQEGAVLVNRGWVPFELADPALRPAGQVEGPVTVTGLLSFPRGQGPFTPDNEPARNNWFFVDAGAMSAQAGYQLPPYYILSADRAVPGGWPEGQQWRLDIPNDHLEYAISWFALALGLLVIYVVYCSRRENDAAATAGDGQA